MTWAAVASAGAAVVGGVVANNAAGNAADASAAGANAGVAENRRQFDTVLNLQAPAINTGNAARSQLASILGLTVPGSTYTPGGTRAASGALVPPKPNEFQGSDADWSKLYEAYLGDPGAFVNKGGKYFDTPAGAIGAPVDPVRGLYGRSGKVWGQIMAGLKSGSTGGGGNQPDFINPASAPISGDGLQKMLEAFPGYRFAVDQAVQSGKALGSASGSLGGNVLTALGERVGGGIALPVFNDYLNRLTSLSGGAQTASNAASNAAIGTGNSIASGLQSAGDARASGIIGQAGSQIGTIGGILGGIGQYMGNRTNPTQQYLDLAGRSGVSNPGFP